MKFAVVVMCHSNEAMMLATDSYYSTVFFVVLFFFVCLFCSLTSLK